MGDRGSETGPSEPADVAGRATPMLGVGMLGYAFMGKAHSHAFKSMPYIMWPPPAVPHLVAICGRHEAAVAEARERYGFDRFYTDWHDLVEDPEVQVFDNLAPNNLHAEPCIAAARAGKHILCEKPLARSAEEARAMLDAVTEAGVTSMVAYNYRFVPALILARHLVKSGRLGEIYHFRGTYLQSRIAQPDVPMTWRLRREVAGYGALGDLGSHTIDLARWLVGEIVQISALTKTFIHERPSSGAGGREAVTVDDAALALLEFENGAVGTLEASRFATGRKNHHTIEINGSLGAVYFDLERLNELQFFTNEDPPDVQGFHLIHVTESHHPYFSFWWPRGHSIGWGDTFTHEVYHFLKAVVGEGSVAPDGATFEDGYRAAVVADALAEAARERKSVTLRYGG